MEAHMSINTPLTKLLNIPYPILLAPMDLVAGARLTKAVSDAGGLGILGGGDGDEQWLTREVDIAAVIAGESSGLIRDIATVRDVMDRIVRETTTLLLQGLRESVPASAPSQPSGV
jgi:IMP dehydrogenase/GMP reductase